MVTGKLSPFQYQDDTVYIIDNLVNIRIPVEVIFKGFFLEYSIR